MNFNFFVRNSKTRTKKVEIGGEREVEIERERKRGTERKKNAKAKNEVYTVNERNNVCSTFI